MLVAFVGIDGSGKSTQLRKLAPRYTERGFDVRAVSLRDKANIEAALVLARRLGEAPYQQNGNNTVTGTVLANALATDFLRHYVANIEPHLSLPRRLVLSDRYAICYEGFAAVLEAASEGVYTALAKMCAIPDITLWFDMSYDAVEARICSREETRAADETPEILAGLVNFYRQAVQPNGTTIVRVPAELPVDDVTELAEAAIDNRMRALGLLV